MTDPQKLDPRWSWQEIAERSVKAHGKDLCEAIGMFFVVFGLGLGIGADVAAPHAEHPALMWVAIGCVVAGGIVTQLLKWWMARHA